MSAARATRAAAFALALLLLLGCDERAALPERERGFELKRLQGGAVSLDAYRGRPVLVDFWATWCAPCVQQVPVLNAFHAKHGARLPVLGVSVDARGEAVVAPFSEEHGILYTVLLGSERLARRWGVLGYPMLFLFGPDGALLDWHLGPISEGALAKMTADWVE